MRTGTALGDTQAQWSSISVVAHCTCTRPAAGASQPHKHVQIVPLPLDDADTASSSDGSREQPPIWPAVAAATSGAPAGQLVELRNLPFAAFAATLAQPPPQQQQEAAAAASGDASTGEYLAGVYQQLLGRCKEFVEGKTGRQGVTAQGGSLSYNMGEKRQGPMPVTAAL